MLQNVTKCYKNQTMKTLYILISSHSNSVTGKCYYVTRLKQVKLLETQGYRLVTPLLQHVTSKGKV